jgi:hypothetical protein
MTYTDITTEDLWLPGDVLGGAVLRGWSGPAGPSPAPEDHSCWPDVYGIHAGVPLVESCGEGGMWLDEDASVRLDCTRPEVRDRLHRVLGEGERCGCDGKPHEACVGCGATPEENDAKPWRRCGSQDGHGCIYGDVYCCPGWARQPADYTWLLAAELRGDITPTVAAGLWWVAVKRAEAGLGPIQHPWSTWARENDGRCRRRDIQSRYRAGAMIDVDGWALWSADQPGPLGLPGGRTASGPKTGEAGKQAADAAALTAGYALLDDGAILLPHPQGPHRLRLT